MNFRSLLAYRMHPINITVPKHATRTVVNMVGQTCQPRGAATRSYFRFRVGVLTNHNRSYHYVEIKGSLFHAKCIYQQCEQDFQRNVLESFEGITLGL